MEEVGSELSQTGPTRAMPTGPPLSSTPGASAASNHAAQITMHANQPAEAPAIAVASVMGYPRAAACSSHVEEHAQLAKRQTRAHSPATSAALEEGHAVLVGRLETGILQRNELLDQERDRHKAEMSALMARLREAEQREALQHTELLAAKQDQLALAEAQRRLSEKERSAAAQAQTLAVLTDAESLNQQKYTLLIDQLEAERNKVRSMSAMLETERQTSAAARAETAALAAELQSFRDAVAADKAQRATAAEVNMAAKAAARLFRAGQAWAFGEWRGLVEERHEFEKAVRPFVNKIRRGGLAHGLYSWREACLQEAKMRRLRRVAGRLAHSAYVSAWDTWQAFTTSALRNALRRHSGSSNVLGETNLELQELVASCHAQELALSEAAEHIRLLGASREATCAHLEAEVAHLKEALQSKRESCEKLKRANAHIIAQFEAAEAEFLAIERKRQDAASKSVVVRVVDAVFGGAENSLQAEKMRKLVVAQGSLPKRRASPVDRMAIVAGSQTNDAIPGGKARSTRQQRQSRQHRHIARHLPAIEEQLRKLTEGAGEGFSLSHGQAASNQLHRYQHYAGAQY